MSLRNFTRSELKIGHNCPEYILAWPNEAEREVKWTQVDRKWRQWPKRGPNLTNSARKLGEINIGLLKDTTIWPEVPWRGHKLTRSDYKRAEVVGMATGSKQEVTWSEP